MKRRDSVCAFVALLGSVFAPGARAQDRPAGRPLRIGLVPDFSPGMEPLLKQFSAALADLGRIEGRHYVYIRSGVFYGAQTQEALDRVMQADPDLLLIMNLGYAVAAQQRTRSIPIVMWVSGFPVEGGVADSLARPGRNVTGLTIYAGGEVFGKLVQLVHEVNPDIRRIGAFMSYVPPFHPRAEAELIIRGMREAAGPLGVDVSIYEIAKPEQVDVAIASARRHKVEALVLTSDPSMTARRRDIVRFAVAQRLPTIVDAPWTEAMGDFQPLLGYWPMFHLLIRQAAPYVDKILWRGANPGDLAIQLPAQFEFVVSLKTARAIGLTVPEAILARVDRLAD